MNSSEPVDQVAPVEEGIYRSLFDNLLNGLVYCRMIYAGGEPVDFVYLAVNDAFASQTGLTDVVGKRVSEVIPGVIELDGELIRTFGRVATTGKPERFEYFVFAMQEWFQVSVYSPEKDHFVAIFDAISQRKISEAKIRRLTNLYAALNQCNQAVVRSTSEEELFSQICRAAVQFGGMKMAWIGMLDITTLRVQPVASCGDDKGYLDGIVVSADAASPFGGGPTGIAIRENRPCWCQDFFNDSVTVPWRERAARTGFGASAALPLHRNGVVAGALNLYSSTANAFDEEECRLLVSMATDISFALDNFAREAERQQAQEDIQEKQQRLSEAQAIAHLGSWHHDLTGHMVWDEETCRIFGIAGDNFEPTPESLFNLIHADDRPAMKAWLDACVAEEKPGELVYRINRPDGAVRFISGNGELKYDAKHRPSHMAGTVQDITERRKTEEALKLFRALIDQSNDAIEVIEPGTFRFLDVNQKGCLDLGYSREELLSMRVFDIDPVVDPSMAADILKAMGESGSYVFETRHRRKDGSEFPVEISLKSVQLGQAYLLSIVRDITERKRTEAALIAAEDQFRGLVEQSIAGIYIIQNGKIVYVNPRCVEIFGHGSAGELIGTDPMSLVAVADRSKIAEDFQQLLDGKVRSILHDFGTQRPDGFTVQIGANVTLATHEGYPAIIGLIQDISEKKRAEEQIQHHLSQLKTAVMSTVGVAMSISEMRDPYTAGHERRVADIADAISAELGLEEGQKEGLRIAASLHDIGKIIIPSEILSKPGKLSLIEFRLIQGHSQAGYDVLKGVVWSWPVAEIVLQHHERMDGSGYPRGLKGEAIMIEARIMAVADVIEAMTSHRPYRAGLGIDQALAEIERGRGSLYDPAVAEACLKLFREKGYDF